MLASALPVLTFSHRSTHSHSCSSVHSLHGAWVFCSELKGFSRRRELALENPTFQELQETQCQLESKAYFPCPFPSVLSHQNGRTSVRPSSSVPGLALLYEGEGIPSHSTMRSQMWPREGLGRSLLSVDPEKPF